MSLSSLRLKIAALFVVLWVCACGGGGSSAPAPVGGITVTPGNGQVTITWNAVPGVDYWLMYAATADPINLKSPPGLHAWMTNVTSPYVLTGLANGVAYSFALDGRINGGAGGPQSPSVAVVPRPAGGTWVANTPTLDKGTIRGLTLGLSTDGNQYYLAVGDGSRMYSSADAYTWSAPLSGVPPMNYTASTYFNGNYLVFGRNGSANNIYYSPDLSTWTAATTVIPSGLNAVTTNGTSLVAVGDSGGIFYSIDGINWTAGVVPAGLTANLYGVAYSYSGTWMAVGQGGTLLSSTDGLNWSRVSVPAVAAQSLRAVGGYGSVWVAAGSGGTVIVSQDNGVTWAAPTSLPASTTTWNALNAAYGQFLLVGSGGQILLSADSLTWAAKSSGTSTDLYAVWGSPSAYLAAGAAGVTLTSK